MTSTRTRPRSAGWCWPALSDLPLPRLSEWLRTWVADRVARNCELVQELSASGSADPVAELLASRGTPAGASAPGAPPAR
ncbi:hypothetical protein ABZW03_41100 [Kitasatospora sp. NPDC004799]|uniref:hypothetical protein n=1 Tax=Kitasatospora sp. NPDC004799 TaxID=3154460 RepID=UPI0033BDA0C2